MRHLRHRYYAFIVFGFVTMLTGCVGVSSTPLTPSPAERAATRTQSNVKYKLLYNFLRPYKNGANPYGGLIAVDDTLYGTAGYGGKTGSGTVFAITSSGKKTTLSSFSGFGGALPLADLTDVNGTLYGTTNLGGNSGDCSSSRCGTVFSMTAFGKETVLHNFGGRDGAQPQSKLISVNGTLYGTTLAGGTKNQGTVFTIATSGKLTVLHNFGGGDGLNPRAGLIDVKGTLYGTTEFGGGGCGSFGCGTVFSITPSGKESVIYAFSGGTDGDAPTAGLINVNGILYGTTGNGGTGFCSGLGCGTVFSVTPAGKETVLHTFTGADGALPWAGLTSVKGKLYGTTMSGGAYGFGTIFSITSSGTETVLYSFAPYGDGNNPFGVLLNVKGTLYGTTAHGGAQSNGTIFSLRL
ncbi:MAG: choice-of-anchor tandem repeat GloVer-containing protein [Candidatus Cybelea sp.]